MSPVPFFDLTRQFPQIQNEVIQNVLSVFQSQQFILGKTVENFEQAFASSIGAKFAVAMSSGTDAQLAILMAMEIGPGDAVITTPYTFFATAGCIARTGAEILFCDIEPLTFNLDPNQLASLLRRLPNLTTPSGNKIRAIIPVHLFGHCARMDEILDIAHQYGLDVIEDAAQAAGTGYASRNGTLHAGSIAPSSWFSFFPTKNLGGAGDGGIAVCQSQQLADRLRLLRNHGMSKTYQHELVGGNFRLDAIQAAVLSTKLPHLPRWNQARIQNATTYRTLLAPIAHLIQIPSDPGPLPGGLPSHSFHQFVLRVPRRDELRAHLNAQGIGHAVYYPIPLHLQPCFAKYGFQPGDFPNAEAAAKEAIALPIFPELTHREIETVASAILDFYLS